MSADPVQILDRLAPPAGWSERTDLDSDPVAAAILERVFADTGNVISLDAARRRRRGIGGAIVVAALVAGGAVAALWDRSPTETRQLACWSDASAPPAEQFNLAWDGDGDPADLCAAAWSGPAAHLAAPAGELQACVTAHGKAAAIPGGPDVCERLGFAGLAAPAGGDSGAVNEAARELDRHFFAAENCVPIDAATTEVRRTLDRHGLGDWSIKIAGTSRSDEICATVFLDAEATTAVVRPVPREP